MNSSPITVGLGEEGRVGSKTTRLQPPGGRDHISQDALVPESAVLKNGSRVTRPPGGASTIFTDSPNTSPTQPRPTKYRMASSFELGDEQPSPEQTPQRRRSKPSVNPLTGELIGAFGIYHEEMRKEVEAQEQVVVPTPTKSTRVPPGGHSTPLW